jgi:hypothetical protein
VPASDVLSSLAALDGVFQAVEAARASVDALLRDLRSPELRSRVGAVTAESVRRSAWASVTLAGVTIPAGDFRAPLQETLARNVLSLYAELGPLAATFAAAPGQALARIHAVAAADLEPADSLGRPVSAAAASRLEVLTVLLGGPTSAPAVVAAAVVHGEVASTGAFGPISGVVARLASRCVLVSRCLDPRAASVPEEGHLRLGQETYAAALAAYGTGTSAGVARWIAHCAEAVAVGGQVGREVARTMRTLR